MTRIFVFPSTKFRNEISSYAIKSRVGSPSRLRNFADVRTIDTSKFRGFFVWKESSQFVSANFSTINSLSFLLHSTEIIRKTNTKPLKKGVTKILRVVTLYKGSFFFVAIFLFWIVVEFGSQEWTFIVLRPPSWYANSSQDAPIVRNKKSRLGGQPPFIARLLYYISWWDQPRKTRGGPMLPARVAN